MKHETDQLSTEIKSFGFEIDRIGYKDQEQIDRNEFQYRYWRIPKENFKLKESPFFYQGGNDFIHFTTIDALFSILNTGYIRLYNLLNMDDKLELTYATNELSFRIIEGQIENAKEQLYCFSMCSANEVLSNQLKEHLLWKLHGRNGNGVMMRISFENNLNTWYSFHLAKMLYNSNMFQAIRDINTITDNEFLDTKMAAFLKLPIYEFEGEIRLIFDNRNPVVATDKDKKLIYPITYPDKSDKLNKIYYFQLPLVNFNSNGFNAPNVQGRKYEIPKMKITEIFLGYRFSEEICHHIRDEFDLDRVNIAIKITDLKKYY